MTAPPGLNDVERLLVVKTSSIGDVIHALPVVQAINEARPGLTLGWLVRRRCADVLRGNPWIDRLHVMDDRPSWSELHRLRREMRSEHYQAALDMQGLLLSGLVTWLSGAPVRVGWDRNREGNRLWLTHPVVPGRTGDESGGRHEVDALYGFAGLFGLPSPPSEFTPQPYLAAGDAAQAEQWLAGLRRPRVALNVGASRVYKRWPEERWAEVADGLGVRGCGLIFVGDAKDADAVSRVRAKMTTRAATVDLAGKTSLRQLAAVLAACDLAVSADTGPMHIAVAVGVPVVALFGATNPARHGPYGARNTVVRPPDAPPPLGRRPTPAEGEAAMRAILPDRVLAAVETKLSAL